MDASASASQVPCGKYDVFISFRGPDVRFGFLSHLIKELCQKNIDVYVDDRLDRGEEISSSLVNAIEGSMIALVIFSKDYASSRWCLEELVKIMECKEAGQQIVIPVFYLIDPSDVRHKKRTYAEAFTLHEEKFKDKVEIWRSVLKKSANLSGHDSSKFQSESKLIDAIVEDVLKKLEDNSPFVPNPQLIGFHHNFTSVESLMEIKLQEVRILGIWGMGGIGKTTLAHAIFDKFLSKFGSCCFLENVREKSKVDGLKSLHQKLISKLLNKKDHIDMNDAMRRLRGKKVLIVLDDVDNSNQLKVLVGQHLPLGPGSRVIVTSRDKHVLRSGGILDKYIHEVNALNFKESLKLFSIHAFNQSHPNMGYQELSETTIAIAQGIPLALEVLGSHFYSRDRAYWESELRKLKKNSHEQIQNILKISYDGLDANDKEIFLDIAFFFIGGEEDEIISVLEACGFQAVSGIQNLIDKALIKSDCYGYIVMHDLIREMAEQIVCKDHIPERRSRLKDADEICCVLKSNKGTCEIEGIVLKKRLEKCPQFRADFFTKMKNLRIIKLLASIELSFGLNSFANKLRYLEWKFYPLESLPLGSYFENLVELHLQWSNVKRLWDGKQDLANLKKIILCNSSQLVELPDLSMAYRLEIVDLSCCTKLRSVHPSILSLHSLVKLDVCYCVELQSLESETHLESLSVLQIYGCRSLRRFCLSSKKLTDIKFHDCEVKILHLPIGRLTELRELKLNGERLRSLPIDELCGLTNLEVFKVPYFKQVIDTTEMHSLFDAWRNLRKLSLEWWRYLSEIPDSIKGLTKLKYLSLEESGVETLPACINHLSSLRRINLGRCKRLKSILGLPPMLKKLDATDCILLETVSSDSLIYSQCSFQLYNCVKLDESSLPFIEELTHSSITSACYPYCDDDCDYDSSEDDEDYVEVGHVCYPGSRVPEWMKYKQMTKASNTIEFTCDLERSPTIVFCCIAPSHLTSEGLNGVLCYVSCDDKEFKCEYDDGIMSYYLDSDHVFLWRFDGDLYDGEISCEFYLSVPGEEDRIYYDVPAEACGVHIIYKSGQKKKEGCRLTLSHKATQEF